MNQNNCEESINNIRVTNFVFADEVAILPELLEVLMLAFDALQEMKLLGLQVS